MSAGITASEMGARGQAMERERLGDEEYRKQRSERGRLGGLAKAQAQLLQAEVTLAVFNIVVRRALIENVHENEIIAGLTPEHICAEMKRPVPSTAIEAAPIQLAIIRALAALPELLKPVHIAIDEMKAKQRKVPR